MGEDLEKVLPPDNFKVPPLIGFAVKFERGRCCKPRGGGVVKLGPPRVVEKLLARKLLLYVVDLVMGPLLTLFPRQGPAVLAIPKFMSSADPICCRKSAILLFFFFFFFSDQEKKK